MYAIPQHMGWTERHFCTRSENRKLPPFGSVSWMEGVVIWVEWRQGVPWVFETPFLVGGTKLSWLSWVRQAYLYTVFVVRCKPLMIRRQGVGYQNGIPSYS
jgi:hypothetical protein